MADSDDFLNDTFKYGPEYKMGWNDAIEHISMTLLRVAETVTANNSLDMNSKKLASDVVTTLGLHIGTEKK